MTNPFAFMENISLEEKVNLSLPVFGFKAGLAWRESVKTLGI